MHRSSVVLDDETFAAWKASGLSLAELIRAGLAPGVAGETLDKLGRRIENLCGSNEGLLAAARGLTALLDGQGYRITRDA
jgi:hypothetical protein